MNELTMSDDRERALAVLRSGGTLRRHRSNWCTENGSRVCSDHTIARLMWEKVVVVSGSKCTLWPQTRGRIVQRMVTYGHVWSRMAT